MIGQSAGMLLFLTSLFLLFPATIPASIHNNRMESADGILIIRYFWIYHLCLEQYKCLQCPAGKGICGNTCKGYFCVKAVEHQSMFFKFTAFLNWSKFVKRTPNAVIVYNSWSQDSQSPANAKPLHLHWATLKPSVHALATIVMENRRVVPVIRW